MISNIKDNLICHIDAGFPIIYINTFEETKADKIIESIACGKKIIEWNGANGLTDFATKTPLSIGASSDLADVLEILNAPGELNRKLFVLKDMHEILNNPKTIAILKNISNNIQQGMDCAVIMVSPVLNIPRELEKFITIVEINFPATDEIKGIITAFVSENNLPSLNETLLDELSTSFKGLSEFEIINLLSLALAREGELTKKDLTLIFEQKQQMIKKAGILEMIPLKESINDIGGLDNLKAWLQKKSQVFKNMTKALEFGVDMPKGVLIAGVPGCGKSLNAKAAAKLFEVPLLRLDMGKLLGKYVGESEANMRRAIKLAEAVSPCILWIDEIEKAFSGIGGDGGGAEVTTRLFGSFLTWLQEKDSPTFVVATANDITKLPPELLRKGRFDEIFYVALPKPEERKRIFEIHLRKRGKLNGDINLAELVSKTDGYSGADIEGVVKESIEDVFVSDREKLTTADIIKAINNTHSLSEIMEKDIKRLSEEYKNRKIKNASN